MRRRRFKVGQVPVLNKSPATTGSALVHPPCCDAMDDPLMPTTMSLPCSSLRHTYARGPAGVIGVCVRVVPVMVTLPPRYHSRYHSRYLA